MFELLVNALVLHSRIFHVYELLLNQELSDWVKARSTTWYSKFHMPQYDDKRWIEHFQVSRSFVRQLIEKLKHKMEKKDTKYKCAILVSIRIACSFYKLAHALEYLQCSELFAIGKSIVHLMFRKFVHVVNDVFKAQLRWLERERLFQIMDKFKKLLGLLGIQGAIDAIQIHIQKPKVAICVGDYYSLKLKEYSL